MKKDVYQDIINEVSNKIAKKIIHTIKNFSVKNWIGNCGLSQTKQDQIYNLHLNASEIFKNAYNMKRINGDCYIDVKNLIVVGEK